MIDGFILGMLGHILGIFFENFFVDIGVLGRLIGFAIALAYFSVLNSSIASGQTVGKRIFNIRVVDRFNQPIAFPRSVLRYFVLATPFLFNGAELPDSLLFSFASYLLSLIIFGGLFSVLYLYIFNRKTRQSLHDLAAGTYVTNARADFEPPENIWKFHIYVVGFFCIAAVMVPVLTGSLAEQKPFAGLLDARTAILKNFDATSASVSCGTTTFTSNTSGTQTTTYVNANISLRQKKISDEKLARSIAQIIAKTYPESLKKDLILIKLIYGFDIGIASRWTTETHKFYPGQI